jgi:hypothetical protein
VALTARVARLEGIVANLSSKPLHTDDVIHTITSVSEMSELKTKITEISFRSSVVSLLFFIVCHRVLNSTFVISCRCHGFLLSVALTFLHALEKLWTDFFHRIFRSPPTERE